jgi:Spy/CpxP family protein refolding chaperone
MQIEEQTIDLFTALLDLKDRQQRRLRAIFDAALQDAQPIRQQVDRGKDSLLEVATSGSTDEEIGRVAAQQASRSSKMMALESRTFAKIYRILSPEQQAQADAFLIERVEALLQTGYPPAPLLLATDPTWREKPISQWDPEEAKQVLTDSPWAKSLTPQWVPDSTNEFARRDTGDWQAGRVDGIGFAGIGLFGSARAAEAIARAHAKPDPGTVVVRWESALPVRAAVKKAGETGGPRLDDDHYAIVIHDIPVTGRPNVARELKNIAYLKRGKVKNLKPSSVEILAGSDGLETVVYLFPRTEEISKRDGWLQFVAQIGRLFVTLNFYPGDMQIRGELEL